MRRVLLAALRAPQKRYFHGAPTRQQAKDIFWDRLKKDAKLFRSEVSETELSITLLNGTKIYVLGLDKPERIEGRPWDGCHITEFGNTKPGAWESNIRPVLSDTNGFALLDGVPEGRNHYYDVALYACGGALPKTEPLVGAFAENAADPEWAYYHWFSSDVLRPGEIEAAKRQMDERTYRQEYEGSFENFEGLAYYSFGRHNISDVKYDPKEAVHVGMDFNLDPMTAALCHIRGDQVFQFGELYMRSSNTFEMADRLKEMFPPRSVTVYPDASGAHGSTNATKSDIDILRRNNINVTARRANPRQRDRVNAVNSLMALNNGRTRYFVNPATCPQTINDLNRVEALADGRLNKDQEAQGLVHISDALGYLIVINFPIYKPTYGGVAA